MVKASAFIFLICVNMTVRVCQAATIHVPQDASTIQAGIDNASSGDTVIVADGTYTGDGNRDIHFGGKNIILTSENGADFCVIDCEGDSAEPYRAFWFWSGEDSTAVVSGFTITGGDGFGFGGGVYVGGSSPSFVDCIITGNRVLQSLPIGGEGGGLYCHNSSCRVVNCEFIGNEALGGGGLFCRESSPTIIGCSFVSNGVYWPGGGISGSNSTPTVVGCRFEGHSAHSGGGICCGNISIDSCVFVNNDAPDGGALYVWGNSTISNSLFLGNSNMISAIECAGDSTSIVNCTFYGQAGSMLIAETDFGSDVTLENCIIAFNDVTNLLYCPSDPPRILNCDVFGNVYGDWVGCIADQAGLNCNFSLDPLFCDTLGGDFHIDGASPCAPANNECLTLVGSFGVGCFAACGNVDGSLGIDIDDIVYTIFFVMGLGPAPAPFESGDVNCSGEIDLDDIYCMVNHIFSFGPAPCDSDGDGLPDC